MQGREITSETIERFLEGRDPMEKIITIECGYMDENVVVIYRDDNGNKKALVEPFYPFVWAKLEACERLYNGNRKEISYNLNRNGIGVKKLITTNKKGKEPKRMADGYKFIFYAKKPMSYNDFMKFFTYAGVPIYDKNKNDNSTQGLYLAISPVEQHMIRTGKRLYKGYNDYDDLVRLQFDLETQGLDPKRHSIDQIGIRTNKGFEKIISITGEGEERYLNELNAIRQFINIIYEINPDVISGHNSENFDWNFLMVRLEMLGTSMEEESGMLTPYPIYKKKKQAVLKLGGEVEYYYPTIIWGMNVTDSLHAVRRAQAQDSDMKKADLKYVTKYSGLNKPNRVYVPGDKIKTVWADLSQSYAFSDNNGKWFKVTDKTFEITYNKVVDRKQVTFYTEEEIENAKKTIQELIDKNEEGNIPQDIMNISNGNVFEDITETRKRYFKDENGYIIDDQTGDVYEQMVTGRYIVERYLLDDLYETDKVELRYNQSNFLIGKMLPTTFSKACTMGTAGLWKLIMLAWSYENNLAIPSMIPSNTFTGGLSRLLCVGYVDRIVKLDYNSLYPSIILTWGIDTENDISDAMLLLLNHVLTEREKYKALKAEAGKKVDEIKEQLKNFTGTEAEKKKLKQELKYWKSEKSSNDKKQLPLKIFGNSFFGSFGAQNIFPWGDTIPAEKTTCIGRQCLRLMIHHFTEVKGYKPLVGDSFTGDTPLFIKYCDSGLIDIKPISELIDENHIEKDVLGREYDTSEKDYEVLCRSGWMKPNYIYRHKTDKDICKVTDGEMEIEVTEDHSLFNENQEKIKPSEITKDTKLEYYKGEIENDGFQFSYTNVCVEEIVEGIKNGKLDRIPIEILNGSRFLKNEFIEEFWGDSYTAMDYFDRMNEFKDYNKTLRAGLLYLLK